MANLMNEGLDENVPENTGKIPTIPAGEYKVVMIGDEIKPTVAGTGKLFVVKNQIIEGEYKQHILKDNLNIKNPSIVCQNIGQGTLKRLCRIVGVSFPPNDTSFMYGKPYVISISINDKGYNQVDAYNPVTTDAASKAQSNSKKPW